MNTSIGTSECEYFLAQNSTLRSSQFRREERATWVLTFHFSIGNSGSARTFDIIEDLGSVNAVSLVSDYTNRFRKS